MKAPPARTPRQAAGATAAFITQLGADGYATRRDLSAWARPLSWAPLALIAFGIAAVFVSIPGANAVYAIAGLVIFGGFTVVDFNRRPHHAPHSPGTGRSQRGSRATTLPVADEHAGDPALAAGSPRAPF
jgi:FtsH-binding integral membrane protein